MSATVAGTVYSVATGQPIGNASVSAPPYSVHITNGSYYFVTPGAATVDVTASAPDYIPQTKQVTVTNGQIKRVDFPLVHV